MGAERTSGGRVTEAWGTLSVEPSVLISSITSPLFASVPVCMCWSRESHCMGACVLDDLFNRGVFSHSPLFI